MWGETGTRSNLSARQACYYMYLEAVVSVLTYDLAKHGTCLY